MILDLEPRSLMRRYAGPIVKKGVLVRLYPDDPQHPQQAYRVKSPESPPPDGPIAHVAT